jgi:hypothetical protein
MKFFASFAVLLSMQQSLNAQELQISGSWMQKQRIEQIAHAQSVWRFSSANQQLALQTPPLGFKAPQVGDWLEMQVRMNPAGMIRRLSWSHTESAVPWLVLGHNSRLSDAAMGDWRWEAASTGAAPILVTPAQRIALRVNRLTKVDGWCVLISDIRPAKPSRAGIANETEARFDWWAQQAQQSKCPTHSPNR